VADIYLIEVYANAEDPAPTVIRELTDGDQAVRWASRFVRGLGYGIAYITGPGMKVHITHTTETTITKLDPDQ
jgi:hypothetical protein